MRVDYKVLTNRLKKKMQAKKVVAQKVASCLAALWNNFCLMKGSSHLLYTVNHFKACSKPFFI